MFLAPVDEQELRAGNPGHTLRGMAGRSDRTREHILDVAEQLYGAEGVDNVSLRRIRIAAGQRNDAAVQYHFGDRRGILHALNARHLPQIQEIVERLLAGQHGRTSTRALMEVIARPWADYVTRGPSERAWIKIVATLGTDPELGFDTMRRNGLPAMEAIGVTLYERLRTRMSMSVAAERVWIASRFAIQGAADRALLVDAERPARHIIRDEVFVDNLVDMAAGILTARQQPRR